MVQQLHITLLGGIAFSVDGQRVEELPNRPEQALLIYLACHALPIARSELAHLFFQNSNPDQARANLRRALSRIKQRIGDVLEANRTRVWMRKGVTVVVDALVFSERLAESSHKAPRPTHHALRTTLTLYNGDFLSGFHLRDAPEFEEWMIAERERLRLRAIQGYSQLVALSRAAGQRAAALDAVNRLLAIEPLLDQAHLSKMQLLVDSGQRSAAVQHYEATQARYLRELGMGVSAELTALYQQLTVQRSQPHTADLIGRSSELTQIAAHLADPACRFLTLVGLGGSGKTTLVLAAMQQQQHRFADGTTFINLVGSSDMAQTVAAALNLALSGASSAQAQVIDFLADRHQLLVLDNCEELLGQADWLVQLLEGAPKCKLLTTSRETFDVADEWLVDVGGLDAGDSAELFIREATKADATFDPDKNDRTAIGQIAGYLGGHPLSIVLAANWVRHFTCAEIAAQLSGGIGLLHSDSTTLPPRQRSLAMVLDASWQRLSASERQTLCHLSVFRAGFTRAAAESVGGAALVDLLRLVQRALLQRNGERFVLHEAIRQFVAARAAASAWFVAADTRASHAAFFAERGRQWDKQLQGAEEKQALDQISADYENIRSAWQYAIERHDDAVLQALYRPIYQWAAVRSRYQVAEALFADADPRNSCLRTMIALYRAHLLTMVEQYTHAETLIAATLPQIEPCDPTDRAYANFIIAATWRMMSHRTRAIPFLDKAHAHFHTANHVTGLTQTLNGLLECHFFTDGDSQALLPQAQLALAYAESAEWPSAQAAALDMLAKISRQEGQTAAAIGYVKRALQINEELGSIRSQAVRWNELGTIYVGIRHYAEAAAHFEAAIQLCRSVGLRREAAVCTVNVAGCYAQLGRLHEAQTLLEARLASPVRASDDNLTTLYQYLTFVMLQQGDLARASACLQHSLRLILEHDVPIWRTRASIDLATRYLIATEAWSLAARTLRTIENDPLPSQFFEEPSERYWAQILADYRATTGATSQQLLLSELLAHLNLAG